MAVCVCIFAAFRYGQHGIQLDPIVNTTACGINNERLRFCTTNSLWPGRGVTCGVYKLLSSFVKSSWMFPLRVSFLPAGYYTMSCKKIVLVLRTDGWPAFDRGELEAMERRSLDEAAELFCEPSFLLPFIVVFVLALWCCLLCCCYC